MSRVEDEVCEMIQQRAKIGLNKYGVTMEREDLTHDEWLEHLQHELMDAIVYIQRLRTREESIVQKLQRLINEPEQVELSMEEEVHSQMKIAKMIDEEHPDLLKDDAEQVDMSMDRALRCDDPEQLSLNAVSANWKRKKEDRLAIFRGLMLDGKLYRHMLWHIIDREMEEKGSSQTYVLKSDLLNAYPKSKAQAYQHFNSVEEHFDTHKEGSKVYVRLKEDLVDTLAAHRKRLPEEAKEEEQPLRGRFIEQVEQVDTLSAYRKRLSDEAKESIAKKKAEGKVFTGEVFGWDRQGDDMVPNWREQDIIDYMRFRHYEQNWSGNKIAKHFNTLELKGKKGGAWTSSMVLRTCRYEFHANRRKFNPPIWWGREAYHDAIEFKEEV